MRPAQAGTPPRGTILLFGGWIVPILTMYLNVNGIGIAPLIVAAVFALSVREAVRERLPGPARQGHPAAA